MKILADDVLIRYYSITTERVNQTSDIHTLNLESFELHYFSTGLFKVFLHTITEKNCRTERSMKLKRQEFVYDPAYYVDST